MMTDQYSKLTLSVHHRKRTAHIHNCHIQARTPTFLAKLIVILVIHFPEQVHVSTVMRPKSLYFHILNHSYIEAGFSHQMSHRNKAKIAPKS